MVPNPKGKISTSDHQVWFFAEGFYSYIFTWLRTFSSIPSLLRNRCWILSTLSASVDIIFWIFYIDLFYLSAEPQWSTKTTPHSHSWNSNDVVWPFLNIAGSYFIYTWLRRCCYWPFGFQVQLAYRLVFKCNWPTIFLSCDAPGRFWTKIMLTWQNE